MKVWRRGAWACQAHTGVGRHHAWASATILHTSMDAIQRSLRTQGQQHRRPHPCPAHSVLAHLPPLPPPLLLPLLPLPLPPPLPAPTVCRTNRLARLGMFSLRVHIMVETAAGMVALVPAVSLYVHILHAWKPQMLCLATLCLQHNGYQ